MTPKILRISFLLFLFLILMTAPVYGAENSSTSDFGNLYERVAPEQNLSDLEKITSAIKEDGALDKYNISNGGAIGGLGYNSHGRIRIDISSETGKLTEQDYENIIAIVDKYAEKNNLERPYIEFVEMGEYSWGPKYLWEEPSVVIGSLIIIFAVGVFLVYHLKSFF